MLIRVVAASVIGATLEWYDFFLYGLVAGFVLNKLYFPLSDPLMSTLLAYGSWSIGFVGRPLGGIIFGHFGDKLGRKTMMVMTILIMGVSTVLIGCLPTYQQIGLAAPLLLISLRILQGIGLGGEWGGAVLMTYEYAQKERRGFFASLSQVGLSLGIFIASGVVGLMTAICTKSQFISYGWRVPFLLSGVILFVGWYIRTNIMETPDFRKIKEGASAPGTTKVKVVKVPLVELFRRFKAVTFAGILGGDLPHRYIKNNSEPVTFCFECRNYCSNDLHTSRWMARG
jgi:MFS family permease